MNRILPCPGPLSLVKTLDLPSLPCPVTVSVSHLRSFPSVFLFCRPTLPLLRRTSRRRCTPGDLFKVLGAQRSAPSMANPSSSSLYPGSSNSTRRGQGGSDEPPTSLPGVRPYNPYQDLQIPYQTIYNLPTSPEFLFQEESVAQRRSWGENLTYYTGCGYLAGAISGAGKGLHDAIRSGEPGDTMKLRVNRILNTSGQTGRRFGNRLGVIGLMYAGIESGMVAMRDTDDWMNSVVAGLGTGVLFKAASGPRSAAVAGAIGGLMVGMAVAGKQTLKRYVPI